MKHSFASTCLAASLLLLTSALPAQALPAADAPAKAGLLAPPATAKASMESMQIPSHGSLVNGLVYVAAGTGPHPTVVLLHGFPGNERNLDLAQDMRRAGWNVMYFNYRGSWGSPGAFSFANSIDDVAAAVAYLRQPDNAKRLRVDTSRIVLVGHSMGGFMAVQGAAADPAIKGIAMISAADFGGMYAAMQAKGSRTDAIGKMAAGLANEGMAPLAGCTPASLATELADHGAAWAFPMKVAALKDRPAFVITSDDGLGAADDAFADALRKAGDRQVTTLHLPTDHAYSDQRTELSQALLRWLATFK
ncbi:alpha/beta fold hydrolase [Bacillus sp. NP157]|nr:alpha/beta fold hydrolase [Bacillus sp. NP157]